MPRRELNKYLHVTYLLMALKATKGFKKEDKNIQQNW